MIPRGTTYRFEPEAATQLLVVEAFDSAFRLPDRGLLGSHALFDPAVLEVPEAEAVEEGMLTWHPVGLHHGPQPGARARDAAAAAVAPTSGHRRMADEVAVMIDARRLLAPSHP